jgi:hypothetical protein
MPGLVASPRLKRLQRTSVAGVGAGGLTDFLAGRGVSPINSCKIPVVIGLTGMAGLTIEKGGVQ